MTVKDIAPYGWDELRDWVINHPLAAAHLITAYRNKIEADDWQDLVARRLGGD